MSLLVGWHNLESFYWYVISGDLLAASINLHKCGSLLPIWVLTVEES